MSFSTLFRPTVPLTPELAARFSTFAMVTVESVGFEKAPPELDPAFTSVLTKPPGVVAAEVSRALRIMK
jgi:hypothetical protein